MDIISDTVADHLADEFTSFSILNPGGIDTHEFEYALASGIRMETEVSYHMEDTYRVECRIYVLDDALTEEDIKSGADGHRATLRDAGARYTALCEELLTIFGDVFGEYDFAVADADPFWYRGDTSDGHLFDQLFEVEQGNLRGCETTPVTAELSVSETVEKHVPVEVADQGEDAIRAYLIEEWWNTLPKSKKAGVLGLKNQILPVGDDSVVDSVTASFTID